MEPEQIEALSSRSIPRLILPDRSRVFAHRAARLAKLSVGHSMGGYLALLAAVAARQQAAIERLEPLGPSPAERDRACIHGMPQLPAQGLQRDPQWRSVLRELAAAIAADDRFPPAVAATCGRLAAADDAELEARAAQLLRGGGRDADPASAVFVMAALQVLWAALASRIEPSRVPNLVQPGLCPICGSLPVVSVVRSRAPYAGYRFLQCGLCASEWHRVRVQCTQCGASEHVAYQSIEGGPAAIRAETCDDCGTYRKIFYQEQDDGVEALADDLASLSLDLLLTDAGFERAAANPLYWQTPD